MTENDKSQVRAFLVTEAAKVWLDEAANGFKEMDLENAKSKDLYDASLQQGKGWRDGLRYAVKLVQHQRIEPHFGVMPIDTTRD